MDKKTGNNQERVERHVNRTLSFLDEKHQSIEESSYFYTRLMGRVRSEESESMFKTLKGALILPTLLVLMLLFNVYTLVYAPDVKSETDTSSETVNNNDASIYDVSSFSEEYNLNGGRL